jgi:hypothetical protein
MTTWSAVRVIAGLFILLSLMFGISENPFFLSKWFLAFTAFVGLNLLQSGLTGWCLMERILSKLGLRSSNACK